MNFNLPYLARSPSDFWKRWHISLSTLAARLPVHPARRQPAAARLAEYRNLMLTMLLGGLWHGASWTFVVWGLYHGAAPVRLPRSSASATSCRPSRAARSGAGAASLMFHLTCLGWLLFRADNFGAVAAGAANIFGATSWSVAGRDAQASLLIAFYAGILFWSSG